MLANISVCYSIFQFGTVYFGMLQYISVYFCFFEYLFYSIFQHNTVNFCTL